jgi:fumarylacetoacetase
LTGFSLANLPYGVFSTPGTSRRCGVRFGHQVLDLAIALRDPVFAEPSLNEFMAQGRSAWDRVRAHVTSVLESGAAPLHDLSAVTLHLPFEVGDYVDFYASEYHASNVGRIFRPNAQPLTPNWKYLPIGYHGRSGTVVVSGTDIKRPHGQQRPPDSAPLYGPSARMDFEAEVGFVIGTGSSLGTALTAADFDEHVFGVFLVNDWSSRDLQAWESVPLGPFLGKSFATSISPWVVPLSALSSARRAGFAQDPEPLGYLKDSGLGGFDLALEIRLNGHVIGTPSFTSMYWTPAQMLAHMTVNGASVRTGDFYASGTVSGPADDQLGCLLELSLGGKRPFTLADGSVRTFLEDGDEITITATAPAADGTRLSFGEVTGRIVLCRTRGVLRSHCERGTPAARPAPGSALAFSAPLLGVPARDPGRVASRAGAGFLCLRVRVQRHRAGSDRRMLRYFGDRWRRDPVPSRRDATHAEVVPAVARPDGRSEHHVRPAASCPARLCSRARHLLPVAVRCRARRLHRGPDPRSVAAP